MEDEKLEKLRRERKGEHGERKGKGRGFEDRLSVVHGGR